MNVQHAAQTTIQLNTGVELKGFLEGTAHFEEPGALDLVAKHAADWFKLRLGAPSVDGGNR